MNRLEARWNERFSSLHFSRDDDAKLDANNLQQVVVDLKEACKVCGKCKKQIPPFENTLVFGDLTKKLSAVSEKMEGALVTMKALKNSRSKEALKKKKK